MELKNTNSILNIDSTILKDRVNIITKEIGINKWDLGSSSSKDISVQVQNGEAKQLKGSQRSSITIRVWNQTNLVGISSTSDLSEKGLSKALSVAKEASFYGNPNETPEFSPLSNSILSNKKNIEYKAEGINKLLTTLKAAEQELINAHKAIDSVPYNGMSERIIKRIYLNSEGACRDMEVTQSSIYLYAKAQEEFRKPRSSGAVRIAKIAKDLDIQGCINEASKATIEHLNYEPIKTGKYLICFTPEAFLDLISAFSSMFNARSILDGVSLSTKESLGERISVPFLSIADDNLDPNNIGSFNFDGEGTPSKRIELIEGGIIKNFIHSEATARKFGVMPTGHAGLGAKVSVSTDWLVINKTLGVKSSNESLNVNKTKEAFILIESLNALHSGVKSSQGSFSLPFDGWIINDNEKTSIEAATIAGDIKTLLDNIINIEDNLVITHQGICPHIWVDNLSITGEA